MLNQRTLFFYKFLIVISPILFVFAAHGAVVTNTSDSGAGSLRAALATADVSVTFNIPANSAGCVGTTCTISLLATLDVTSTKTIDGNGPNRITVFGNNNVRVFNINGGGINVTIDSLTIRNGAVAGNGAGINFVGGASLTIINSTVRNNAATGNNRQGGGLFRGNIGGTVTIRNSTFNDNTANGSNGQGGAIYFAGGTNIITNSTFSKNQVNANNGDGGAIYVNNAGVNLNINHGTFTLNSAIGNGNNDGGAIYVVPFSSPNPVISNTIIAQNESSGIGNDINGTFTSGGNNLIGDGVGSLSFVNSVNNDQVGTFIAPINAMLAALADNTGPTQTHALNSGSPAIDKAANGLTIDQRGLPRPYDNGAIGNAPNGSGQDIGAFEVQAPSAASVSVGGQIDARFSGRTLIRMTDTTTGETRTEIVNSFGFYKFDDVEIGKSYLFEVINRRHQIAPRVITVIESISNLNFSGK